MFTINVQTFAMPIKSFLQHVTRGVARATAQEKLFAINNVSRHVRQMLLLMLVLIEESTSSFRQNARIGKVLPRRKPRRFEAPAAQSGRKTRSARHFATVRAKRRMHQRVAEAELEWQLAEVGSHAIPRQWQAIARVPHQMSSKKRLRVLVSKGKERIRAPPESAKHGSMRMS